QPPHPTPPPALATILTPRSSPPTSPLPRQSSLRPPSLLCNFRLGHIPTTNTIASNINKGVTPPQFMSSSPHHHLLLCLPLHPQVIYLSTKILRLKKRAQT